jgi:hypothetical protein
VLRNLCSVEGVCQGEYCGECTVINLQFYLLCGWIVYAIRSGVSLRNTLSLLVPVDLLNRSLSSDELKMELVSKTGL